MSLYTRMACILVMILPPPQIDCTAFSHLIHSIDGPMPTDRKFISYDDARLCALKVAYVRRQRLGGLIIWELGGGYRASQPMAQRDALLQTIKRAWFGADRQVGAKDRSPHPRVRSRSKSSPHSESGAP